MFEQDDIEFDIQKTILKKKEHRNSKFYVEYDKLTNQVFGITPEHKTVHEFRRGLLEIEENDLVREIFNNKTPLHLLRVKYDHEQKTRILYKQYNKHKSEFDFIRGERNLSNSFIHVYCDVISKSIRINFVESVFMDELTKEKINESLLQELPDSITLYCIDKHEPSRLYDTIEVSLKILFSGEEQQFKCFWLPDNVDQLADLDFLHYNHNLKINISYEPLYVPVATSLFKPSIIYKQTKNKLEIQSAISEVKNFYLGDNITFYLFDAHDPGQILDTISLNSAELDNFKLLKFDIQTARPIKMISNYSHLHIEEANANTYYEF